MGQRTSCQTISAPSRCEVRPCTLVEPMAVESSTEATGIAPAATAGGKYRIDPPEIHGCRKLIGRNTSTILELFGPLIFNGSLEFTGNSTLLGAVKDKSVSKSCFSVSGNLTVSGTFLSVQDCEAAEGGAIQAQNFLQHSGSVMIKNCSATSRGGAISVGDFRHLAGNLTIRECSAKEGGGIAAATLIQEGGTIVIQECHAQRGGAIYINTFDLRDGLFTVQGCTAQKPAESVDQWWAHNFALARGGELVIRNCSAVRGGAIFTEGVFNQSSGLLRIQNCKAVYGGGLYASHGVHQSDPASAKFEGCEADYDGGGMVALRSISLKGKVEFLKATAGGHGAGIYMEAGGLDASNLCFKGCTAEHDGAAIFVQGPATLQHLETEQCTSSVSSSVLYAKGDLSVSDLTTNMKPSKSDSGNQYLNSAGIAYVTSWMCKSEQKCALVAEKGSLRLGYSAEFNMCYSCPENAEVCHPMELKMPFGMSLIQTESAYNPIYCPNPEACPGGRLATEDRFFFETLDIDIEEVQEITMAAMCAEGYIGEGCFQCSKDYSIADGNPLTCTPCPSWSTSFVARGIAFYAAKDLILFVSATVNAIAASPVKRKQSAVLLNQLMAFATVSDILFSGIMYTKTFHNITTSTRRLKPFMGDRALSAQNDFVVHHLCYSCVIFTGLADRSCLFDPAYILNLVHHVAALQSEGMEFQRDWPFNPGIGACRLNHNACGQ
eukprot:symbB.v1.2.004877.t1/scaffold264.1/size247971/18